MSMAGNKTPAKRGVRASLISIVASLILAGIKLTTGLIGKSHAMVSDAANSISDLITYTVVMTGVAISERKADSNHQYGHEKVESIVAVMLALAIFATGTAIGYKGVRLIMNPELIVVPSLLPMFGAMVSIIVKSGLFIYVRKVAKKTNLSSLKALSIDHLTDVFASLGALIGIGGARLGVPVLDAVASIIISLLIIKSSIDIFRNSANILLDISVDDKTVSELKASILMNPQVQKIDILRTRSTGPGFFVEVEICCAKTLTLEQAHAIAQDVHDRIERDFPRVKHVMVHTNPCDIK